MNRRKLCKLGLAGVSSMALAKSANAMNMFTTEAENKKWVVLYGSQCGSTAEYANFINKGLGDIADVVDIAAATPKVEDYDFFIIGGWRNANSLQPAKITDFVKNNKTALKEKIKGLFVVLGNGGVAELKADHTSFLKTTLVTPSGVDSSVPAKVLFGRHKKSCDGLAIADYDNVNEDAGVTFGASILSTALTAPFAAHSGRFAMEPVTINSVTGNATVKYSIPNAAHIDLALYSFNGQRITTLISTHHRAGNHSLQWNARNLAPGFYLLRLKAENGREVTRSVKVTM